MSDIDWISTILIVTLTATITFLHAYLVYLWITQPDQRPLVAVLFYSTGAFMGWLVRDHKAFREQYNN